MRQLRNNGDQGEKRTKGAIAEPVCRVSANREERSNCSVGIVLVHNCTGSTATSEQRSSVSRTLSCSGHAALSSTSARHVPLTLPTLQEERVKGSLPPLISSILRRKALQDQAFFSGLYARLVRRSPYLTFPLGGWKLLLYISMSFW